MKNDLRLALIPAAIILFLQCLVSFAFLNIDAKTMLVLRWIGLASVAYFAWKSNKKSPFGFYFACLLELKSATISPNLGKISIC